jgi:hypothetical protein
MVALVERSCTLDFDPGLLFWQSNITKCELGVDKSLAILYCPLNDLQNKQLT